MNRKQFFGNFIGLIGVATNVKELSSLSVKSPLIAILPPTARPNDIVMCKKSGIMYVFTGSYIFPIDMSKGEKISAIKSNYPANQYIIFSNAVGER